MRPEDLGAAMRLKQAAAWNQTEQDWVNVMALEPEGCWVWEQDAQVVGTTTAVCYGQELAWIGMVLVLPECRGKGIGRRLMEHALEWLERRGIRQVKLDATDMGRPLYEKLGFHVEQAMERWGAAGAGAGGATAEEAPAGHWPLATGHCIAAMDRECFGVDRVTLFECLLAAFPGQGLWLQGKGFCLGRPGSNAYYLGPCQAVDAGVAGELIRAAMLRARAAAYFWDLFPAVGPAVDLARELGFERKRTLWRMALRPQAGLPGRPERVFGVAGFEYG
jgi:GNAT superfamily N-acetyltransferase